MSWKDELRKAPFNIGIAQDNRTQQMKESRESLLRRLPKVLERNVDKKLREQINDNPNRIKYKVPLPAQMKMYHSELRSAGVDDKTIEEDIKELYEADMVRVLDNEIVFMMKATAF